VRQVQYVVQAVDESTMRAAVEAADELSRASSKSKNHVFAHIQAGAAAEGKIAVKITTVPRSASHVLLPCRWCRLVVMIWP
jgi:hypothetical protein